MMLKCPTCGLVARDVVGVDGRKQRPPVGALVLCECGAVNRAEGAVEALILRTLTVAEFEALPGNDRRVLERGIDAHKRAGRYRAGETEREPCAHCGHERRQHLDPRWPCSMLACGCPGFASPLERTP